MRFGLGLDMTARGGAGDGGGGGLPSSVTHFWAPSDMTFDGSNVLTGVTDRVAESSAYIDISGTPSGNTLTGIAMSEAASNSYIFLTGADYFNVFGGVGNHMAFLFRRNATADDHTALLGRPGSTTAIRAISGDPSNAAFTWTMTDAYSDGVTEAATVTRGELWSLAFEKGTNVWSVVAIKDMTGNGFNAGIMFYNLSSGMLEGDFAGFARFTDWSQRSDVETALLAEVS